MESRLTIRRVLAVVLGASLVLAACGDDPASGGADTEQGQAFVRAVVADLDTTFPLGDAECAATAIINAVGLERLTEANVDPAALTTEGLFEQIDEDLPLAREAAREVYRCTVTAEFVDNPNVADTDAEERRLCYRSEQLPTKMREAIAVNLVYGEDSFESPAYRDYRFIIDELCPL